MEPVEMLVNHYHEVFDKLRLTAGHHF